MSDVVNGEGTTEVTEANETVLAPDGETNAQRFKRLATKRLIKALDALDILSNCSAEGTYEYTPEQVDKLEKHLTEKVAEVVSMFRGPTKVTKTDDLL